MEDVTTGVSSDTTRLVNPLCAITAVEASAPQVVGSLPPLDEFAAPVHQEQIVAEETTQNFGEIPKEYVAPTPAATDMDAWVESLYSLHNVPLTKRLHAQEGGVEDVLTAGGLASGPIRVAPSAARVRSLRTSLSLIPRVGVRGCWLVGEQPPARLLCGA